MLIGNKTNHKSVSEVIDHGIGKYFCVYFKCEVKQYFVPSWSSQF